MSRIDELLAETCPDGVKYRTLSEVGELVRGRRFTKADYVEHGLGSIHYGEVYTEYGTATTEVRRFVRSELRASLRLAFSGDLVIAATGENVEEVGKAVAWLGTEEVAVHDDCYIFRHGLDPKYVAYFFQSSSFQEQKKQLVTESKLARISGSNLAKIKLPIPPLEVQREIVSILDKLERLQAELQAELQARAQQYEFYRDRLLSFERERERVRWAPMSDVGEFYRGKRFTKADYVETGGIPCLHYGEIYTTFGPTTTHAVSRVREDLRPSLRFAQPGDVVLADVGETVADVGKAVAWLGTEDVAIHDHCYAFRHELDPAFVSYYLQTSQFHADKAKHVARTKVKTLLMNGLAKVKIPVPPREEQERIVAILDRFDALVNDLSAGLPAEIAARRQQYEYYRDKLLTFPERPEAA